MTIFSKPNSSPQFKIQNPKFIISLLLPLTLTVASAQIFMTDFNNGNDSGLTRISPLASVGAPGNFSFPNGAYRIQAPASPDPEAYGPGRAMSVVSGHFSDSFHASVDLVDWDGSLDQTFGLIAGVNGSSQDPWVFTYSGLGPGLFRLLPSGELSQPISYDVSINLIPGEDYRFVFTGSSTSRRGEIYSLDDLDVPIVFLRNFDVQPPDEGQIGLFASSFMVADSATPGDTPADVTFDNLVLIPEPSHAVLALSLSLASFAVIRSFRRRARPGNVL